MPVTHPDVVTDGVTQYDLRYSRMSAIDAQGGTTYLEGLPQYPIRLPLALLPTNPALGTNIENQVITTDQGEGLEPQGS